MGRDGINQCFLSCWIAHLQTPVTCTWGADLEMTRIFLTFNNNKIGFKMDWLLANKEWVFSGAGVTAIVGFIAFIMKNTPQQPQVQSVKQTVSINVSDETKHQDIDEETKPKRTIPIEELKKSATILFIDDDKTFKIVGILKKMGWLNTKLIKDINSLSDHNVVESNVLFIDIQGVGKLLQLKDEGLGLALAIKRRYPEKKIIIYSAQEDGARFHEALSEADYSLPKTAEPVRFEETIIKVFAK